jgi:hypothetical protein
MKLTNKLDLPQAIVDAVRNDGYDRGNADISVTGLLRPPRLTVLEREHASEIEEDVSDRIWSLFGQSIHTILERANRKGVAERRLSMEVAGWVVSGGMDLYEENGTLSDYKTTTVWKLIKGDMVEWEKQLNMYAVILRHHGHEVQKLQVVAILRDWSKGEAERDPYYPQAQVVNIDIKLWEPEAARIFMQNRVVLHQQAKLNLPECSPEDRWARPNVWAVMKEGRKTAVKLYDNEDAARAHVGFDKQLKVVLRPGASVRCQSYCRVSRFCAQYQASLAQSDRPSDEVTTQEQAG